ncbi:unnamed protein product, partial [Timema podura]|nr:unnamed protein product [Timema podura]
TPRLRSRDTTNTHPSMSTTCNELIEPTQVRAATTRGRGTVKLSKESKRGNITANFVLFQQWEEDDYRLARFIDRPKQINTQFAIDLIAAVPPMPTKERVICCDGGGGPTGHPKVFINLVSSSPNTPTSTTQRSRSPTTTTKSS